MRSTIHQLLEDELQELVTNNRLTTNLGFNDEKTLNDSLQSKRIEGETFVIFNQNG